MSLGPDAAAVVTKAVSQMPSPPMQEVGIFAAGEMSHDEVVQRSTCLFCSRESLISRFRARIPVCALRPRPALRDPLHPMTFYSGSSGSPAPVVSQSIRPIPPCIHPFARFIPGTQQQHLLD